MRVYLDFSSDDAIVGVSYESDGVWSLHIVTPKDSAMITLNLEQLRKIVETTTEYAL